MLHQRSRWEMKLSALPAASLSICSAIHPSRDLSTSGRGEGAGEWGGGGGAGSHLKLLGQLSRDLPRPSQKSAGRRGAVTPAEEPSWRLSAGCAQSSIETLSGCFCMH